MAVGSALGGWASAVFGYKVAFLINAASFLDLGILGLADTGRGGRVRKRRPRRAERASFFITELKEGFHYTTVNRFAFTILIMNVIWATGGGAINIVFERMGGVVFAGEGRLESGCGSGLTVDGAQVSGSFSG